MKTQKIKNSNESYYSQSPPNIRPRSFFLDATGPPSTLLACLGTPSFGLPPDPKFRSASTWGGGWILGPPQIPVNFSLLACGLGAGFSVPPNTRPRLFFWHATETPARALLCTLGPQILVCQHTRPGLVP